MHGKKSFMISDIVPELYQKNNTFSLKNNNIIKLNEIDYHQTEETKFHGNIFKYHFHNQFSKSSKNNDQADSFLMENNLQSTFQTFSKALKHTSCLKGETSKKLEEEITTKNLFLSAKEQLHLLWLQGQINFAGLQPMNVGQSKNFSQKFMEKSKCF